MSVVALHRDVCSVWFEGNGYVCDIISGACSRGIEGAGGLRYNIWYSK